MGLIWVAEKMKELGCTEALNLDGGNSVKLVFMGELVNSDRHYNQTNDNVRHQPDHAGRVSTGYAESDGRAVTAKE